MKIKKIILVVIISGLIGLYFNKVSEIKILEQQLSEPGEFFERYLDKDLSQEEFEQKYADAKIIVGERLRIQGK